MVMKNPPTQRREGAAPSNGLVVPARHKHFLILPIPERKQPSQTRSWFALAIFDQVVSEDALLPQQPAPYLMKRLFLQTQHEQPRFRRILWLGPKLVEE